MEKKDFGSALKGKLQGAAEGIKATAQNVKMPEIKLSDIKEGGVKAAGMAKETGAKAAEVAKETGAKTAEALKEAFKKKDSTDSSTTKIVEEPQPIIAISAYNAVKVFYYLMAADGEIFHSEEEKFDMIGEEVDPLFKEHREQILTTCKAQLDKIIDSDDYYDVVQDGVEEALLAKQDFSQGYIVPKLLVWNLLTLSYSDENYNDTERKLMKYIVRKLDVSKDVFLEMEHSYLTIADIEKEITWIKTTDRPYLTIEAMVGELTKRENDIFESVKALIAL